MVIERAGGGDERAPLAAGTGVNGVELGVVVFFFLVVSVGGFLAARWRAGRAPRTAWTSGGSAAAGSAP